MEQYGETIVTCSAWCSLGFTVRENWGLAGNVVCLSVAEKISAPITWGHARLAVGL